jgi:hypothetical protein
MLFQPFRLGVWARLAVVSLVTGEFASGVGGSFGNVNTNSRGSHWRAVFRLQNGIDLGQMRPYLPWIALGAALILALLVLWVYCDSVYRFILLDAVLSGQCRLREGWRRWRSQGRRYFLWILVFSFCALFALGLAIGVPVFLAFRAGWFEKSDQHFAALLGGGFLLLLLIAVAGIAIAVTGLVARDFLVPVIALENAGVLDRWRRLLSMLRAEKMDYAGYVLMKIVLAVGSAILFTIVNVLVGLLLMIPLGLVGVAGFFIGKGAGLSWTLPVILLVCAFGVLALAGILYAMGFVYAPALVFFQSYALQFFGSRYAPLANKLFPAGPPQTPPATLGPPPEPSPA